MADGGIDSKVTGVTEKHHSIVDASHPGFESTEDINKVPLGEGIRPGDQDTVVDPRLQDYPIPLVAKCVSLENDPTEPILTFRFWVLSTFWVIIGCGISSFYYFKPYYVNLTSYAVQLLAWGMGYAMAKYLPKRQFNTFGWKWSLNSGPWNAKEHALIVVAYWGSCYTAYGLGPLSALELYYGKKINAGWSIVFLITTQMMGYGFAGLYRDILVRPPKMYYPGVLPNVALFNAMHRDPATTRNSLRFFGIVAVAAFCYEWFPSLIWPLLGSLPLVCYFGHGHWKAWVLGSGTYGFGVLDLSLDWNYISFLSPLYTPLWSTMTQSIGVLFAVWFLYPIMYFSNTMNAKSFQAMSSSTFDDTGAEYNISRVMNPDFTLNQTAMDAYSKPYWSPSYAMYFFWGFAATAAAIMYAALWYGKSNYDALKEAWNNRRADYNDPYLKLMSFDPRVPHWWYLALLVVCAALAFVQLYEADMGMPWWGLVVIGLISFIFTWPNGILWAVANLQIGMAFLAELISGGLFPGNPVAVLTSMSYGRQILEQNLNLISDYKFGFYMKIPEREMFIGQVWGTLIGPFINYGMMRFILDHEGPEITGQVESTAWLGLKTRNFYSTSVVWGVIGPRVFFSHDSIYNWVYYGFVVGAVITVMVWAINKARPKWNLEEYVNPTVFFYGATLFPVYTMTNFMTSALVALFFMGYMYRYHPVWFRKYNYLLGVGLDCGTQLMQTVMVFCINLPNVTFPEWWGNNLSVPDRCFPPANLPTGAVPAS
ncbi:MAG: hypothetical protein Q9227_004338 [Pyrenula ochraceoflavens]